MMPPLRNPFLGQAALCSAAAVFATGCGGGTTTIAAGAGLGAAALGLTAWAAYRRFSAPVPAAVRLQTPTTQSLDFRKEFLLRLPLLREADLAPVLEILERRTGEAWKAAGEPTDWEPFLQAEIAALRDSLQNQKGNAALQRLRDALDPSSHLLDELIDQRLAPALKPDSDLFTAVEAIMTLKAIGLRAKQETAAGRAIEILAMDGIFHADTEVATLAIKSLTEIADVSPTRVPSTSLIALRLRGFAPGTPPSLTAAAIEALARIATPEALRILLWDGLSTDQNEEVVALARRALIAAFERRPEIFSEEMRETLKNTFGT